MFDKAFENKDQYDWLHIWKYILYVQFFQGIEIIFEGVNPLKSWGMFLCILWLVKYL